MVSPFSSSTGVVVVEDSITYDTEALVVTAEGRCPRTDELLLSYRRSDLVYNEELDLRLRLNPPGITTEFRADELVNAANLNDIRRQIDNMSEQMVRLTAQVAAANGVSVGDHFPPTRAPTAATHPAKTVWDLLNEDD